MDFGHTMLPAFCKEDILSAPTCNLQLEVGALPCDAWHHYYHYQSSAQYLWLAETLRAQCRHEEAIAAYAKAIFQDHGNEEALAGRKTAVSGEKREASAPLYDKHPFFDREFRTLTGQLPDEASRRHDKAAMALLASDRANGLAWCKEAIITAPSHSNSYFLRGKYRFLSQEWDEAHADFMQAVRLSHALHDAYHRDASAEHLVRGRQWLKQGENDLAISDFTKALDLYRGNTEARIARAQAYRAKGNWRLAEEDERPV